MPLTGNYSNDVQYLIEMGENAPLDNDHTETNISPQLNSKERPFIGLGYDLLGHGRESRWLSPVPLRVANLLRIGIAPARHGSRSRILARAINAIVRLSRWAIRPAGCFLLSFSVSCATGWVSNPPSRPVSGICRVLLYRLNHTSTPCIATAIDSYPNFIFPGKTLDASKHVELIAKLIAYNGSPFTYFKAPLTHLADRIQFARELVQAGGTLKIWHTRLLKYFGPELNDSAPSGKQTIAILSRRMSSPDCPAYASLESSQTFVVLPDLSGPDPRVKQGPASLLANTYPVLYRGNSLLVSEGFARDPTNPSNLADDDQVIIYDPSVVVNQPKCWFQYYGNDRQSVEK